MSNIKKKQVYLRLKVKYLRDTITNLQKIELDYLKQFMLVED